MSFSSGDLIAIGVGSIGALRWVYERVISKSDSEEEKLYKMQMDFEVYKAGAAEREKNYVDGIARIERSVRNLQSQLRTLITGGSDKVIEIHSPSAEN